jgi:hypothetical protein
VTRETPARKRLHTELKTFDEVLHEEREAINRSRSDSMLDVTDRFSGLALSGGGIRSATFNLGVLQALAELKLLQHFDYLSTVSGGGYIGSWLSALIAREGEGKVQALLPKLAGDPGAIGQAAEYPAIQFLRRYSNYLTPRLGLFSADSLTFVATVLRNLYLNLTVLVLFASAALMLPRFLARLAWVLEPHALTALYASVALLLVAIIVIAFSMGEEARKQVLSPPTGDPPRPPRYHEPWFILLFAVAPTTIAAYLMSHALVLKWAEWQGSVFKWAGAVALLYLLAWAIGLACMRIVRGHAEEKISEVKTSSTAEESETRRRTFWDWFKIVGFALFAGVVGGLLFSVFARVGSSVGGAEARQWLLTGIGTALMLKIYSLVVALHIGLAKHSFSEQQREWWSRLAAWVLIVGVAWFALFLVAVLGPPLWQSASNWLVGGGAAWIATTVAGVLFAKGERTSGRNRRSWREAIAVAAPYVFVGGLLLLLAIGVHEVLRSLSNVEGCAGDGDTFSALVETAACEMNRGDAELVAAFLICVAIGTLMAWRIDINIFSLHHFYRNRLTRAYLGATRYLKRDPQPFTGFDAEDDLPLYNLSVEKNGERIFQRPYHIINSALNLAHGQDLAWQTRKAASFTFTPRYCGFELPPMDPAAKEARASITGGYRSSASYMNGIRLGAAMAISGAAVSPSMGYHTSAPLAVLMTVFNVRLGRWCGNPLHDRAWGERGPTMSARYLMNELFSLTTIRSPFLYLSDGGHFENLGLYELVRRRCRLIVACDAAADERFAFVDLGNAIRKCQADFGIAIELDVGRLRVQKDSGRSVAYFAAGTIHYEEREPGADPGMLFYIKPCLTGKEPSDILNYASINTAFPHQTTSDQWFDEPQFESYRKLGYHIALDIFSEAKRGGGEDLQRVFDALKASASTRA